jgi:hypothetical protein
VLLSGKGASAGFGIVLCSGPFCTVPGTQVRSPKTVLGTITPLKSSFAFSLNSTSRVSSLAVWVPPLVCLSWRGFLPVRIASCSSLASWRAAFGLPPVYLRSCAQAAASASFFRAVLSGRIFASRRSSNLGATVFM